MRGAAAEGEAAGGVEVAGEAASMMTAVGGLETVAGAVGVDAPDPFRDPGPGHPEDAVPPLVAPLSARGVLGPALSVLPEGIVLRGGTLGHVRGPAPSHLVGGNVQPHPHLPANANPVPAARSVIAVALLIVGGGTREVAVPGHVVEALATGQVDVVGALPLRGAESRTSPDPLHRIIGGAKEARATAAAAVALAANPPAIETTRTLIAEA